MQILIFIMAAFLGMVSPSNTPTNDGLAVGDKAPNFTLKNVDGKKVSLSDYKDAKGVIVVFTCNHCPYAVLYEDRLIELHNTYAPKGYPVVAINPNDPELSPEDSFEKMIVRSNDKKFPFKYLFDEEQTVFPAYGATRTPHFFLLDNKSIVRYIGAMDDNSKDAKLVKEKYLENAIAALEKDANPSPDFTKAVGCTIKVK